MKKLKIAYISSYNSEDANNWSGLGYYISKTLQEHVGDVEYFGSLKYKNNYKLYYNKIVNKFIYKKNYMYDHTETVGRQYAKQVNEWLKGKSFDLIFSPGTIPIAYLDTNIPIVFWTDATFASMIDYYFTNLSEKTIQDGNKMEQEALDRCSLAIYSSDWAADSALNNYKVEANKVKVIPFGANIKKVPEEKDVFKELNDTVKLLFVGKGWDRKGGTLAVESLIELKKMGIDATLTIVGSKPPAEMILPKNVTVFEFLDKNKKEDFNLLYNLYKCADFFLLPTRKECYGVVFCEANSFGLPIITSNTGGISTIVEDGENGYKLPLNSKAKEYALKIKEIIDKPSDYKQLSAKSRKRYDSLLNWNSAGFKLQSILEKEVFN